MRPSRIARATTSPLTRLAIAAIATLFAVTMALVDVAHATDEGGDTPAASAVARPSPSSSAPAAHEVALPPWSDTTLPPWAQSVQIIDAEQPLRMAPNATAKRRGSAHREARLPLFGTRFGPGCHTPWLHVGPQAWACGDDVLLSGAPPLGAGRPNFHAIADGLPYRYFFASRDGSLGYHKIEDADVGEPAMSLEPGFAVAIVDERSLGGQRYGLTNRGLWVPMRDFGPARTNSFRGSDVTETPDGVIPVAWVVVERAPLFARRGRGFTPTGRSKPRFTQVGYLEKSSSYAGSYARIDDSHWLRTRDIRHPTIADPPAEPEIDHGARWIDIELASQTLVAYEGRRPVFATIVSTGKGKRKGHPFETPKGVHRVWVKLLTTTMDNLENDNASRYWRIEDVPYVQFFHKGVGLHAAFWHRSFGHVRSHGCVNLAPLDAQRLFWWTGPRIPNGWTAALPTDYDRGAIIRVR